MKDWFSSREVLIYDTGNNTDRSSSERTTWEKMKAKQTENKRIYAQRAQIDKKFDDEIQQMYWIARNVPASYMCV